MQVIKNEKTAEIVGLCFGDGSLTTRNDGKHIGRLRFQLRGHIIDDREHYDTHIKPLFKEVIEEIPTAIYKGKKPYYGISTEKKSVCEYLHLLNIPIGVKKELQIPNWILKNKKNIRGFLRGFLDTDGTIFCQKNYSLRIIKKHTQIRLKLSTISKNLAQEMKSLLDDLKIKNLFKIDVKKKSNEQTAYHVEICGGINVDNWFKQIGSSNPDI
jgi:hypothetical protein